MYGNVTSEPNIKSEAHPLKNMNFYVSIVIIFYLNSVVKNSGIMVSFVAHGRPSWSFTEYHLPRTCNLKISCVMCVGFGNGLQGNDI